MKTLIIGGTQARINYDPRKMRTLREKKSTLRTSLPDPKWQNPTFSLMDPYERARRTRDYHNDILKSKIKFARSIIKVSTQEQINVIVPEA
jgi:hypothetical protein